MSIEYIQALIAAMGGLGGIGAAIRWAWVRMEARNDLRIEHLEAAAKSEREALDKERAAVVGRLESVIFDLQSRVLRLEIEVQERDALIPAISEWIGVARYRAHEAQVELPDPPPLFPTRN